ncbi:MAG TPA: PadR family transcriptional regulator [Bacteroidales bacterium]|nr:PadR family transcriptional regulator [Bacteroidales bacterium]HQI70181.1 PadR family transcriptional regulator [Bacteroidales bacterium]
MDIENTKAQMRKGILEYCILSIIAQKDMYASDIMEKLKEGKLIVVEGTLYPLMTRLKNDGLLNYRWEESKAGPPRKYYTLTETGRRVLESLDESWNDLVNSVKQITKKQI